MEFAIWKIPLPMKQVMMSLLRMIFLICSAVEKLDVWFPVRREDVIVEEMEEIIQYMKTYALESGK